MRDAIRLFEHYTELIAPTKAEQRQRQMLTQATRAGNPPDMAALLRRQMAGAGLAAGW